MANFRRCDHFQSIYIRDMLLYFETFSVKSHLFWRNVQTWIIKTLLFLLLNLNQYLLTYLPHNITHPPLFYAWVDPLRRILKKNEVHKNLPNNRYRHCLFQIPTRWFFFFFLIETAGMNKLKFVSTSSSPFHYACISPIYHWKTQFSACQINSCVKYEGNEWGDET